MDNMREVCRPLDYKQRHKAMAGELLVDYSNGNIYVTDKSDRNIIHDVTDRILKQLDKLQGDKVELELEGIGKIKLTEVILQLLESNRKTIKAHFITDGPGYYSRSPLVDNRSLRVNYGDIEMSGFNQAEEGTFPVKSGNTVKWIKVIDDKMGGNNTGHVPESEGGGSVIGPANPDNGRVLQSIDNAPFNGKIYLKASRRQKTVNPIEDLRVVLPSGIVDEHSTIEWMVLTSDKFNPTLEFDGNIQWDNSQDVQPKANSHNLYVFKTWTSGAKWIGEAKSYNNDAFSNVSSEYLSNHYYSKDEIDRGFYNKGHINDEYYNKQEIDKKMSDYEETDNTWTIDI